MINIFTIGTHAITRTACKLGIFLATQNLTFEILLFDYILVNATLKCDHKPERLVKDKANIMAFFFLVYILAIDPLK
jgi:Mg2+/Co2+ transporter CorB